MDRLWGPWRMRYVSRDKESVSCFLCDKSQEPNDAENFVLYRQDETFVLLNTFPYNSGHIMVAPYSHVAELSHLKPEVSTLLWTLVQRVVKILKSEYGAEGFNIGVNLGKAGGAGLAEHLHIHVVPRWIGDTNFMPTIGGTKVLPESLEDTYRRVHPWFDNP